MKEEVFLVPVNRGNWNDCADLELEESQAGNLASNLKTIAESAFEPHYELRAITLEGSVIGMLAYCPEIDEPLPGLYWLFRIMVDKSFQNLGYGKAAIRLCIEEMRERGALRVRTMCRPDNEPAQKVYASLGFSKVGKLDDGDVIFELGQQVAGGDATRVAADL
jgi:diamine N-acetyltransferase